MPIPTQTQASAPQIGALFDPELAQRGSEEVAKADAPSMVQEGSGIAAPEQRATPENASRQISVGNAINALGELAVVLRLPKQRGRHASASPTESLLAAAGGHADDYAAASAELGTPLLPFEVETTTQQDSVTDATDATARIIDGVPLPAGVRYVGTDTPEADHPAA